MLLASKDEPADEISQVAAILKIHPNEEVRTKSHVETYEDAAHGWMAARADLENEASFKEYQRGYEQVVSYLNEHLTAAL